MEYQNLYILYLIYLRVLFLHIYGEHKVQDWKDNFHTGFNLECIWKVAKYTGE